MTGHGSESEKEPDIEGMFLKCQVYQLNNKDISRLAYS